MGLGNMKNVNSSTVRHDVVSGFPFFGGGCFKVNVIPLGFHLFDLRIGNFQTEFLLNRNRETKNVSLNSRNCAINNSFRNHNFIFHNIIYSRKAISRFFVVVPQSYIRMSVLVQSIIATIFLLHPISFATMCTKEIPGHGMFVCGNALPIILLGRFSINMVFVKGNIHFPVCKCVHIASYHCHGH